VIFGHYPLVERHPLPPLHFYVQPPKPLAAGRSEGNTFVLTPIVASGQTSVERALFDRADGVYCDELETPAAEEYELSFRLLQRGIPLLRAPCILAGHNQPIAIDSFCRQQYRNAVGCAEAAVKYPATLELQELRRVITANGPITRNDSLRQVVKKSLKRLIAIRAMRIGLMRVTQLVEVLCPRRTILTPLYSTVISAHFCAGVRDGLRKFSRHNVSE
jgi:hypothetical protein